METDWKKKYEEALAKARAGKSPEEIFPELNESEDERIRKEMMEMVNNLCNGGGVAYLLSIQKRDEYLAWLENQKEASKAIEVVERIDKYIDDHLANAHDMKDSNSDKKYYRGWDDALGKMAGILQDVYSGEKQKEQKPAEWSEEDLQHKSWILECLADGERKMPEYAEDFRAAYKWLKSLPEKIK